MCKGVCTIANCHQAAFAGQSTESLDRKQLTGQIRDVTEMQNLRARRNRLLKSSVEIILGRGHWKGKTRQCDSVTPDSLVPRCQHPPIILIGCDYLVPSL